MNARNCEENVLLLLPFQLSLCEWEFKNLMVWKANSTFRRKYYNFSVKSGQHSHRHHIKILIRVNYYSEENCYKLSTGHLKMLSTIRNPLFIWWTFHSGAIWKIENLKQRIVRIGIWKCHSSSSAKYIA